MDAVNETIQKLVERWLIDHQNPDGGWGENHLSYFDPKYAGVGNITVEQTARALIGLMKAGVDPDSTSVRKGVKYILERQNRDGGWNSSYTAAALAPFRNTLYGDIFCLNALAVYRKLMSVVIESIYQFEFNGLTYNISIRTPSNVLDFNFDPMNRKLSFYNSGEAWIPGICNISMPKQIVASSSDILVYLDSNRIAFTLTENATVYFITLTYHHSQHKITLSFFPQVTEVPWLQDFPWSLVVAICVIMILIAVFLLYIKRYRSHRVA